MNEIIGTNGDYRVRLEADDCRDAPDWDGQGYVIHLLGGFWGGATLQHKDYGEDDPSFDLEQAIVHYDRDYELVERYLRIFHDVVSFDYIDWDRGRGTMFFVVTRQHAEKWGCPPEDWHKLAGQTSKTWEQYAEGEVYGWIVEKVVTWHREGTDETLETWEHVDSLWGMYGYEYAHDDAIETLDAYANIKDAA